MHFLPDRIEAPLPPSSAPQRLPFGWDATALLPGDADGVVLHWNRASLPEGKSYDFRLTVALDQREAKTAGLFLAQSGARIGELDLQFGYSGQRFEVALEPEMAARVAREGLRLRLERGAAPFWFWSGSLSGLEGGGHLLPHLFAREQGRGSWEAAYRYLASVASIQPFGWIEGCVLEGLRELASSAPGWSEAARRALATHLELFLTPGGMRYENPRGLPVEGRFVSMEATLMLPAVLDLFPEHPILENGWRFWMEGYHNGIIGAEGYQKCEVCYTVAYPLALLARARGDEARLDLALDQLLRQKSVLHQGDTIYQAHYQGKSTFPNWARGLAWYLLGFARVLEITGVDRNANARAAAGELRRACDWVIGFQRADGLWNCYAHEPQTGAETSGSGGIAAALLLAHRLGCASPAAVEAAHRAVDALEGWLSVDGALGGVCQSNKPEAGEALQRDGFRAYSQMGLGLAVQAALLSGKGR